MYRYSRFDSPIGTLFIGYSERGVSYLGDGRYLREFLKLHPEAKRDDKGAKPILKELEEYFGGSRRKFDIKLDLKGSDFQLKVWREISKIPYGETRSYGQLARAVGMPKAYRAVGLACKANRVLILVPCHRVVSARGLGGYSLGLWAKKKLLRLEGAKV